MTDRMQETKPGFRPHREDFKADWTKNIPEHWEVRRLKFVAKTIAGQSPPSEIVSAFTGRYPFLQGNAEFGATSPSPRLSCEKPNKSAEPGDILLSVRAPVGAMNIADQIYGIGRGLCAIRANTDIYQEFLYHTLTTTKETLKGASTGSTYDAVSIGDVASISTPVPPPEEQAAIVRFLDHADEQIRRYIAGKERLIALLEEERQALVHQAVTRGLDPNVRLKDSGVEWLGDVPEHWRVGPLKRAFVSMDYGISESASDSGAIHLLTMGNLRDGQVIVPQEGGVDSVDPYLLLREGDLLFNRTNSLELVGKVGLFAGHESPTTFASYLVRMRPHPNHAPEYLNMALNDASFISSARRESVPSLHQSNLNPTRYGRLHIALPPKEEQSVMLRVLQEETVTLRNSVARTRRQIDLMNEYRTRLIADVVTGQLDVRETAAQLEAAP